MGLEAIDSHKFWKDLSYKVKKELVAVAKDQRWVGFFANGVGIITIFLAQPWLILVPTAFTFPHNILNAHDSLKSVREAVKVRRFSDAFFWGGASIKAVGSSTGDMSKLVVGCIQIAGLTTNTPAYSLIFNTITPVALLTFSTIGVVTETWAGARTFRELKKFNHQISTKNYTFFNQLLGIKNSSNLDQKNYIGTHFFNKSGYVSACEKLAASIENVKNVQLPNGVEKLSDRAYKFFQKQLQGVQNPQTSIWNEADINEALQLYEELIQGYLHSEIFSAEEKKEIVGNLRAKKAELEKNRVNLLHLLQSEFHHRMLSISVGILSAFLGVTAGALALGLMSWSNSVDYQTLASGLALASASIDMAYILFEKAMTQDKFLKLEKYLFPKSFEPKEEIYPGNWGPIWWWEPLKTPDPSRVVA